MAKITSLDSYSRWARLSLGASALALVATAHPAFAQDDTIPGDSSGATTEEIIVTGIRASLKNAQSIKKNSDTVVDSVTAEDIGALPDRSVNEALQRIPGVAITRYASPGDSQHFSVEGSGVVIRGLTYVKGEFNGRDTFSANGGREISFNDVAPELVSSIDVFKNLTADRIEGGIAGTVSINTRKPFDSNGRKIYVSAENNYGDLSKRSAPSFTGLFSDQWTLGDGSRIGLLVSGTYSKLYSKVDSTFVSSPLPRFNGTRTFNEGTPYASTYTDTFDCPDGYDTCYAPAGGGVRTQDFDRRRYGIAAALQYASPDDRFIATGQFLRTNGRNSWTEHTIEPNVSSSDVTATFPADGTSYTFDDRGAFVSGTITRPAGGALHAGNLSDGTYGNYTNFQSGGMYTTESNRGYLTDYTTDDYALNLRYDATDRLHINLDGQYVTSKVKNTDVTIELVTFADAYVDASGKIPQVVPVIGYVPDYGYAPTTEEYFSNPNSSFIRDGMTNREDNDGHEWAFRGDLEYDLSDDGFLRKVRFGGRYSGRDQVVRTNNYNNWGAVSDTWTSNGPQTLATIDSSYYQMFSWGDFFRGAAATPPSLLALSGNPALQYDKYQDMLREATAAGGGYYTPLEDRTCTDASGNVLDHVHTYFCPSEVYRNREQTFAAYTRLDFSTDDGGTSYIDGNVGLRFVRTKEQSFGAYTLPNSSTLLGGYATRDIYCATDSNGADRPICDMTSEAAEALLAFADGSLPSETKNSFNHWLPSLNIRWHANDKLQFRFAASRGISRPAFNLLTNYMGINVSETAGSAYLSATAKNPLLKPVEATQFDVTGEWYFSRVGSLTASLFYKRLTNIIDENSQNIVPVTSNGVTYDIVVNGPSNLPGHGDIKGIELAYQQTFSFLPGLLSGLGTQLSYTYVDPGKIPTSTPDNSVNPVVGTVSDLYSILPLPQLSKHNANATVFYETGKLSARLAYSWRSKFLLSTHDTIFPYLPVFSEATGQLDGSIFLTVNDNFKIGLQGSNLLNEVTRTSYALYNDNGSIVRSKRAAFINDRRFSISVRLTY